MVWGWGLPLGYLLFILSLALLEGGVIPLASLGPLLPESKRTEPQSSMHLPKKFYAFALEAAPIQPFNITYLAGTNTQVSTGNMSPMTDPQVHTCTHRHTYCAAGML